MPTPSPQYHPAADQLQTGDLLFPKRISAPAAVGAGPAGWTHLVLRAELRQWLPGPDTSPTMEAFLGEALVDASRKRVPYDVSALLAPARGAPGLPAGYGARAAGLGWQLRALAPRYGGQSPAKRALGLELGGIGLDLLQLAEVASEPVDPTEYARRISLMYFILTKAFPDLLEHWLGMSVDQFLQHPLSKLLLGALQGESGEDGLFIGHVAMVLCETDGQHDPAGKVWVIEANATDFSHYSVAVHPYLVAGEPLVQTPLDGLRLRGWANQRLARGDSLWHSRHSGLMGADAEALRGQLVHEAKKYLGRRYGFFDDPDFGDDGRFYCAEFVHRVFTDLGQDAMRLDENRTWRWLVQRADLLGSGAFARSAVAAIHADGLYARVQDKAFFLITLPMLYACTRLQKLPVAGAPQYQPA